MRTPKEIKAELKRIAKVFRQQMRADERAAKKERDNDCPIAAADYEGNASAMKYCAEHVEAVASKIREKS